MEFSKLAPVFVAACLLFGGCSCHGGTQYIRVPGPSPAPAAPRAITSAGAGDTIVAARFRNVNFHVWPGVALRLMDLNTHLRSRRTDGVVSFDDAGSFVVDIDHGTAALSMGDLGRLMNTYVFAYRGAPLRDLAFSIEGNHLVQKGVLHKVVDIPFTMTSDVSVTPKGEIRVHPVSMKICSIPGKGLMDALGITLEKLLDVRKARGVRVDKNDLLLDPTNLLPPPALAGHLVEVRLEPGLMVQRFAPQGAAMVAIEPDSATSRYMIFQGGTLQFGKLFMVHSDMQVVDLTPGALFEFDIARYHQQLVAGHHRTLADYGLLVFMPDIDKVAPEPTTATAANLRKH